MKRISNYRDKNKNSNHKILTIFIWNHLIANKSIQKVNSKKGKSYKCKWTLWNKYQKIWKIYNNKFKTKIRTLLKKQRG